MSARSSQYTALHMLWILLCLFTSWMYSTALQHVIGIVRIAETHEGVSHSYIEVAQQLTDDRATCQSLV